MVFYVAFQLVLIINIFKLDHKVLKMCQKSKIFNFFLFSFIKYSFLIFFKLIHCPSKIIIYYNMFLKFYIINN